MIEQLPITIHINNELLAKFSKIDSVCSKLEAQFNFQTLTANWYGDEHTMLTIQLSLETSMSLIHCYEKLQHITDDNIFIKHFSDDVICHSHSHETELKVHCYIALTESELKLLEIQPKLLTSFIQIKLHKVLNLIAEQYALTTL